MPSRDDPLRIVFDFDGIKSIQICDPVSWEALDTLEEAWIHPKEFFMTSPERFEAAWNPSRRNSTTQQVVCQAGQELERYRLEQKTEYDLKCRGNRALPVGGELFAPL